MIGTFRKGLRKMEDDNKLWLNSLTDEERESLTVSLCRVCYHGFNDNPGNRLCRPCARLALDVWDEEEVTLPF